MSAFDGGERGRPFVMGNTMGRGRPKGSRNKEENLAQALLEQYAEPVTKTCLALALKGNAMALRLAMRHLEARRKDAPIKVSLPCIRTVRDLSEAAEKVTQATARGEISRSKGPRS